MNAIVVGIGRPDQKETSWWYVVVFQPYNKKIKIDVCWELTCMESTQILKVSHNNWQNIKKRFCCEIFIGLE